MSESYHTVGFEVCRFLIQGMEVMHDEDRAAIFEGLRLMFCMFCGKRHPEGGQCLCWDGSGLPQPELARIREIIGKCKRPTDMNVRMLSELHRLTSPE